MKVPHEQGAGEDDNVNSVKNSLAGLRDRLTAAPLTERTRLARDHLRIAETRIRLVVAMLETGLDDCPEVASKRSPTRSERLRAGLEAGTFKPANAAFLLNDLNLAATGNREAQKRIIAYLQRPGVLEALDE